MAENGNGKHKWVAIGLPILIAVVGVLGFFYGVGQRTNKIAEVVDWKAETAPRIERMDAKGTTSFKLFHEEYLRTQERQEARSWRNCDRKFTTRKSPIIKERLLTLERK